MEILQFLLSFFAEEFGGGRFKDVFALFKENSFDVKKTLKNIKPETAAPIIKEVLGFFGDRKTPPVNGRGEGLAPIIGVADEEIIKSLNAFYFASDGALN